MTLTVKMNGNEGWRYSDHENRHHLRGAAILYLLHIVAKMCLFIHPIKTLFTKHLMCWAQCSELRIRQQVLRPLPASRRRILSLIPTGCVMGMHASGFATCGTNSTWKWRGEGRKGPRKQGRGLRFALELSMAGLRSQSAGEDGHTGPHGGLVGPGDWVWPMSGGER